MENEIVIKILLNCIKAMDEYRGSKYSYRAHIYTGKSYLHYNWDRPNPSRSVTPVQFSICIQSKTDGAWSTIFDQIHYLTTPEEYGKVVQRITAELFTCGLWSLSLNQEVKKHYVNQ